MPLESKVEKAFRKRIGDSQAKFQTDHVKTVRRMLDGDHWLEGSGWVGPRPSADSEKYAEVMAMIKSVFLSQNLIEETATRHRDSVVGEEPQWSFTLTRELGVTTVNGEVKAEQPTDDERSLILEANAALSSWWNQRRVWSEIETAVLHLVAIGKGVLRLYIPASAAIANPDDGTYEIPRGTLAEVLSRIYVESGDPYSSGELRNRDKVLEGAYFTFKDENDKERLELQRIEGSNTLVAVETARNQFLEVSYPLKGNLMLFEMTRRTLISQQVIQQQKAANKFHTMLSRNTDSGGFVERTILNAQMPGNWIADPDNPGKEKFVPSSYQAGAGMTNFMAPYVVEQQDGTKSVIPASINYRDPVSVKTFTDSLESAITTIYHETKQTHILISGDATVSQRSRDGATNEYRASLKTTKTQAELCIAWLLETALRLGAHLSGDAKRFEKLRASVSAQLTVTQPTSEDISADINLSKNGHMSSETVMLRSGRIPDAEAEKTRMRLEARERFTAGDPNALRDSVANAKNAGIYSQRQSLLELGFDQETAGRVVQETLTETLAADTGIQQP